VIDFGDLVESHPICDLAVACAYGLLHQDDPLTTAGDIVAGYYEQFPLTEDEIALLFPLICMRLSVSVTNSAIRKRTEDDPYIVISEQPAWEALGRLRHIHPRFAHYAFRDACGLEPVPHSARVRSYLQSQSEHGHVLLGRDLRTEPVQVVDLSVGSPLLGADPENATVHRMTRLLDDALTAAGTDIAIGRYDEPRLIYQNLFATGEQPYTERRTIHIGLDLWMTTGTPLYAPLAGVVEWVAENAAALDYGPLLILRHATDDGDPFYTLYGHLAPDVLERWKVGDAVARGDLIAHIGAPPQNGDWAPHLHLQIINDLLERGQDFPGVALASQRPIWRSLSPDPNLLLRIPEVRFPTERTYDETLAARKARIGGNLSLSYRQPLKMVRGWRQHLYDHTGRAYLDMYNNVPHVGHSHPHVVRAIQAQTGLLTTNTRYLHDNILRYAEALCERTPTPLEVCYFVNSASEANELALRLALAYTGGREFVVMDTAYHGHTSSLIDISPYKFDGKGGTGKVDWVHVTPVPDDYRGLYRRGTPEIGKRYADELGSIITDLRAHGRRLAAFIAESLPSVGGQIIPPPGYFAAVYEQVRAAGGVCIADEVQVGFGRLGAHFWGFELDQVVPDIVVCGKPVGNGYPLGVVLTTRAIADAFDNGMEFFSTFGGNPVACAAGLALLEVLERENLQENATRIGRLLLSGLHALADKYAIIGDVRGIGLFLGVELVNDRQTLDPAADQASYIVNRLRDDSILAGTDGPLHNVIKLRPAMIFHEEDARYFLDTLDTILAEDGAAPRST
jgi:4-aminobutyrate aminotransferase-like enzyme